MIRLRLTRFFAAVLLAVTASAQQHPNVERGFQANKAYAIDGIEGINLFNGNLNLTIPIGSPYSAGGDLQYAFRLTYAGNDWNYAYRERLTIVDEGTDLEEVEYLRQNWSEPDADANAGMGWRFSLGRMIHPEVDADAVLDDPATALLADPTKWVYESPDGGIHAFYPDPNEPSVPETGTELTLYTRDGSYIRYTKIMNDTVLLGHRLEFPNGIVREFRADGSLQSIEDRFDHKVTLTIDEPGVSAPDVAVCTGDYSTWTISDGHRSHYVYFRLDPVDPASPKRRPYGTRLCQADLASFGGARAQYKFHYQVRAISRQAIFTTLEADGTLISPVVTVPLLTEIEQPDGSRYKAVYDIGMDANEEGLDTNGTADPSLLSYITAKKDPGSFSGHVRELTLPTRGRYAWSYGTYAFPLAWVPTVKEKYPNFEQRAYRDASVGVRERRHYQDSTEQPTAKWTYTSTRIPFEDGGRQAGTFTTVTDPANAVTEHYFSTCRGQCLPPYNPNQYGLPFVARTDMGLEGLYLSSRAFVDGRHRTTYVKYEMGGAEAVDDVNMLDLNRRLQERLTVYEDGSRVRETFTEYDGLGHYRKVVVSDGTTSRQTFTNYNPGASFSTAKTMTDWVLEAFDHIEVSQGITRFRTDYCFDAKTGFLLRKRTRRSTLGALDESDLLAVFTRAADGTETESHYGGDGAKLSDKEPDLCKLGLISDPITITHTFTSGVRSSSRYTGVTFSSMDNVIDANTGLPSKSRDPQQRETSYVFDRRGRLDSVKPAGRAWTKYTYDLTADHPSVRVAEYASTDLNAATPLTESWYYYDGLGRLIQQKRRMPAGWSTITSTYDGFGRAKRTYVPAYSDTQAFVAVDDATAALKYSELEYDALGRTKAIKEADGSTVTFTFAGPRETRRTVKVATKEAPAGKHIATVERLDGFGRLIRVDEQDPAIATDYTYDAQDRLTTVEAGDQTRTFKYDGAGLLIGEHHPELGQDPVYTYDARGKVKSKTIGTTVGLTFAYDEAERLKTISGGGKVLKEFGYDDGETGALTSQTRHNLFPDQTYSVKDTFAYEAATGRLAAKTTDVTSRTPVGGVVSEQKFQQSYAYNELSAPSLIKFPTCESGCGGLSLPQRNQVPSYSFGMLTGIDGVTAPGGVDHSTAGLVPQHAIAYDASGAVVQVVHANPSGNRGVVDEFVQKPGLPRLAEIIVHSKQCDLITSEPQDARVNYGQSATFSIAVVPGAIVTWYEGVAGDKGKPLQPSADHPNLTIGEVKERTFYWASATLAGGSCEDASRSVAAIPCTAPTITMPAASPETISWIGKGKAVTLTGTADGSELSYKWIIEETRGTTTTTTTIDGNVCRFTTPTPAADEPTVTIVVKLVITNICGTAERIVARYRVGDVACETRLTQTLNAIVSVPSPNVPYNLQVALAPIDPNVPNVFYHFQWFENGVERKYDRLPAPEVTSQYGITMRNSDTVVRVRAWAECYEGQNRVVTSREEVYTYATVYGRCDVPPVSVTVNGNALKASSTRPNLAYQWYRGSSGDTRRPIFGAIEKEFTVTSVPGTYWVRGTASCGGYADSPSIPMSSGSCEPVRIAVQPRGTSIAAGSAAHVAFAAMGRPEPDTIQWYNRSDAAPCNGTGGCVDPNGPNTSSFTPAPIRTTDYWAVVSNGCDSTTTIPARIHVTSCADIQIESQPQDVGLPTGTPTELRIVVANADPTLLYQWYEGEGGDTTRPIAGATGPALAILTTNGRYWVRLSFQDTSRCAVDSRTVVVAECTTPVVLAGNYISDVPGQTQILNVDMDGDPSRLSYDWYLGEQADESHRLWSDTDQLLVMPQITTTYTVKVTRGCPNGNLTTQRVLQVSVCPQNLPRPLANEIAYTSVVYVVRNARATLSLDGPLSASDVEWFARPHGTTGVGTAIGTGASITTPPITEKMDFWARFRSGECTRDTEISVVDVCSGLDAEWTPESASKVTQGSLQSITVRAITSHTPVTYEIYEGARSGDLADSTRIHTSSGKYSAQFDTTRFFWARVTGQYGCYVDTPVHTVSVCVPDIQTEPQPVMFDKLKVPSVPLTVVATPGDGSLSYQWFSQNGGTSTSIDGATAATYNAAPQVDTSYWVRVTGCDVSDDSTPALVTVCKPPAITHSPASSSSTKGALVTLTVVASGTGLSYQWYELTADGAPKRLDGETSTSLRTWPQVTTDYRVTVTGTCGSVESAIGKVSIAPEIVSQPVAGRITSGTTRALTVVASGPQLHYEWYALNGSTWSKIDGAVTETYTPPAITQDRSFYGLVRSGSASTPTEIVTFEVCLPRAFTFSGSGVSGSGHNFHVTDPQPDQTYLWYVGEKSNTTTLYASGSSTTVFPTETTRYWLRTRRNGCDADGATVTVPICIPKIGTQPAGRTVTVAERHTLSVSATGTGPLTYQWYTGLSTDTRAPISGATGSSYTPPASSETQTYWVRVSSPLSAGCSWTAADSQSATITICHPPQISAQPSPVIVETSTSSTTLLVTASGSITSYQWYEGPANDTSKPVGPNNRSFPVVAGSTKSYWVRVHNSCGFVDSRAVLVSVRPKVTTAPASGGVCQLGESVRLSMAATGATSYQWCRLPSGSSTWETLAHTGPELTIPVTVTPTYFIGSAVSGDAVATTDQVVVTLYAKPPLATIARRLEYTGTYRLTAKVTMTEESSYTFRWYEGALGTTSKIIGYSDYVFVTPKPPVTYWVRVTDDDTGCYSDMADSF